MASADAFGFVDPADVLRCCHIIPTFTDGKVRPDRVSLSRNARDGNDWKRYYVNRWVLRGLSVRFSDLSIFSIRAGSLIVTW